MVRVEEINAELTKRQKRQVERLEKKIDKTINKDYVPDTLLKVYLWGLPHLKVQQELKERYKKDKWLLTFTPYPSPLVMISNAILNKRPEAGPIPK